ncbi:hypothetical protein GPA22_04110 [Aromatoleum toluvorans]|uniref:DnrO protein n=1 Tax=Aromatoleum toluvorans TaxID=92002 RepID=A0ABX1PTY8_9RHOO|nr:hypothetical protein [Aromatoleum toluvorans]NMG42918.1 hypothetical protein [Aromatoleum toluvorans]
MRAQYLAVVTAAIVLVPAAVSATSAGRTDIPATVSAVEAEAARRWRPTEEVRGGIDEIRTAISTSVDAGPARPLDAVRLAELGRTIDAQISQLLACCTKDETSVRHLNMLLAEMSDGTQLMRRAGSVDARRMGLLKVLQALNLYGTLFDHPGWRALDERIEVSAR